MAADGPAAARRAAGPSGRQAAGASWPPTPGHPPGRAHALWTLHGLGALDDGAIEAALKDATLACASRRCAWPTTAWRRRRSCGRRSPRWPTTRRRACASSSPSPWARPTPRNCRRALAGAAGRRRPVDADGGPELRLAVGSRPAGSARCRRGESFAAARPARSELLTPPGSLMAPRSEEDEAGAGCSRSWSARTTGGMAGGTARRAGPGAAGAAAARRPSLGQAAARPAQTRSAACARSSSARPDSAGTRAVRGGARAAARLLGYGPFATAGPPLQDLLTPQAPSRVAARRRACPGAA